MARDERQLLFYTILAALVRRHREPPDAATGDLTACELSLLSQNGEDGVLAELLRRLGPGNRSFVEFGVEAGREGNCVFLADVLRWSGLFMEADLAQFNGLAWKYRGNPRVATRRALVSPENVNDLFHVAHVPADLDVLSIDIDGNDFWVWAAITCVRPRILVIEYNAQLQPGSRLVQPYVADWAWDGTNFSGASLGALRWLGQTKGYRLIHTELTGNNAFFVRDDLVGCFADLDLESVPIRSPNIYLTGEGHPPDPHKRQYIDLDQVDAVEIIKRASGR